MTVHHIQDFLLCQDHEVVVTSLNGTNRLGEAEDAAIQNIVRT